MVIKLQFLTAAIFVTLLFSCSEYKRVKKNNFVSSLQSFKKGIGLMAQGFKLEVNGSDSSKIYYEQAIKEFLAAYYSDTSNIKLVIYLPDLYAKLKKIDSALLWSLKLSADSIPAQK